MASPRPRPPHTQLIHRSEIRNRSIRGAWKCVNYLGREPEFAAHDVWDTDRLATTVISTYIPAFREICDPEPFALRRRGLRLVVPFHWWCGSECGVWMRARADSCSLKTTNDGNAVGLRTALVENTQVHHYGYHSRRRIPMSWKIEY